MSSTILLPPRAQLCIRYCSNKQQLSLSLSLSLKVRATQKRKKLIVLLLHRTHTQTHTHTHTQTHTHTHTHTHTVNIQFAQTCAVAWSKRAAAPCAPRHHKEAVIVNLFGVSLPADGASHRAAPSGRTLQHLAACGPSKESVCGTTAVAWPRHPNCSGTARTIRGGGPPAREIT